MTPEQNFKLELIRMMSSLGIIDKKDAVRLAAEEYRDFLKKILQDNAVYGANDVREFKGIKTQIEEEAKRS